jgi:hypothetical protein
MWYNSRNVTATYAHYTTQWAWAYISGLGWLRIQPGAADGVNNLFIMMNAACANGKLVNVFVVNNLIQTAYMFA